MYTLLDSEELQEKDNASKFHRQSEFTEKELYEVSRSTSHPCQIKKKNGYTGVTLKHPQRQCHHPTNEHPSTRLNKHVSGSLTRGTSPSLIPPGTPLARPAATRFHDFIFEFRNSINNAKTSRQVPRASSL